MSDLLLAYYADDFTGATDALECLSLAGVRTALFSSPPSPEQLAEYPGLRAIGVAGMTRSMSADAIEVELRSAFAALRRLGAPRVHYKVCSTFDSSPNIGSIGRAIDVGAELFPGPFVPVIAGSPALGRYCVFGNLFAQMGIASGGEIFRLDRHPSMSRHPVTPADEADIRWHLARQTKKAIGLVDVVDLSKDIREVREKVERLVASGVAVVLFDVLTAEHAAKIAELLGEGVSETVPQFLVGSSAIEMCLGAWWNSIDMTAPVRDWPHPGAGAPLLVASGSCSPVTNSQIAWGLANGFSEIVIDAAADANDNSVDTVAGQIAAKLDAGVSVILHTGAAVEERRDARVPWGTALGRIVVAALERSPQRRVCFCGGDTSSQAARELGIESLSMIAPLSAGAPLCKARAPGTAADGVEFVFKGGQVGGPAFFGAVADGRR
jgi:uncharacterized protein YgbK (DUF1537 family)